MSDASANEFVERMYPEPVVSFISTNPARSAAGTVEVRAEGPGRCVVVGMRRVPVQCWARIIDGRFVKKGVSMPPAKRRAARTSTAKKTAARKATAKKTATRKPARRRTARKSTANERVEQQIVDIVKNAQDAIVETVRRGSETAGKALPDLPAAPGADQLPKAEQFVENAFDLAQRLLNNQREFAERLVVAAQAGRNA